MGWTGTARAAAAEEYGRRNWARYAARRRLPGLLVLWAVVFGGLTWAGRRAADLWRPEYNTALVLVGCAVALLVLIRGLASLRRPYRMPRRRYRRY